MKPGLRTTLLPLAALAYASASAAMVDNPLTGERINVPDRDWNQISPVVSELEGKLSRWDYGMLLRGLDDWFKLREYYLARSESRDRYPLPDDATTAQPYS